jgi:glycosyltransferase involved in cell wall biosynthesis
MNNPIVSIVLSVYNGVQYLLECLQSIENPTYTNWELVIINDGSTDNSNQIIVDFIQKLTNKVQYFHLETNKGLPYSLNLGIQHAKGEYIARIDADDVMMEKRLQKQITFLEQNSNIGLVGSPTIDINEDGNRIGMIDVPLSDKAIKNALPFFCSIIHGTILIRKKILANGVYYRNLISLCRRL